MDVQVKNETQYQSNPDSTVAPIGLANSYSL